MSVTDQARHTSTMKKAIFTLYMLSVLLFTACTVEHGAPEASHDYVQYVNPLMGTQSSFELSAGNTYPAIAMPWGMNFWTPRTN